MTDAPLALIARGSDADVLALDDRRVLRRYRRRNVPHEEVAIMTYARERGYPVPAVLDVSGADLILERVTGPEMANDLFRRPWLVRAHAATLAGLHHRLHAIAPPEWLRGDGPELAHLDLHPRNVLLAPSGPVVIDWANARRAKPGFDVAVSAVITGGALLRWPVTWLRDLFVRDFVRAFPAAEWRGAWDDALSYRRADDNVSDKEKAGLTKLRF